MTTGPVRVAVALGNQRTEAAAVTPDGHPVAAVETAATGSAAADVDAALARLLAAGPVRPGAVAAVVVAGNWAATGLHRLGELSPVLAVRLAASPRSAFPPLAGWPEALRTAVSAGEVIVSGGRTVDGSAPEPLDRTGLRDALAHAGATAAAVSVTGTFSGVSGADERAAERIIETALPGLPVVLSHHFGVLGLLERENTAVLNAALTGVGRRVTDAVAAASRERGVHAPCFVVRTDGTLMLAEHAARFPLLTHAGCDAAWLRGGALLAGVAEAFVCRVTRGGVAVGVVRAGRPRLTPGRRMIAGVPTTVAVPQVVTARAATGSRFLRAIEPMRDRGAPDQLVVVGPPDDLPAGLPGFDDVLRPRQGEFAAALGAALAPVGATAEAILPRGTPAGERRATLTRRAVERAVGHGADPDAISVVEVSELPLPYLPDSPVRVRARVEGPPQLRVRPS
ncbi:MULTISPECIES: hydantoinase/oxoprolinase family protein [Amycolatopsis]|uniref:hydantoinase/oxoprolinase family protein n=1 Tax=Amycolatopsis TaxID=1813 RepID=UPI000B8B2128|nr:MULTISPECIES: hydantoinase/oxoprolinase family protein [Amycolatopsis]OXM75243.1 hypothetical protein CF166_01305 [Amycolatopsis sp. KNN50.9b]